MKTINSNTVYQQPEIEEVIFTDLNSICAVSTDGATIGDADVTEYGEI